MELMENFAKTQEVLMFAAMNGETELVRKHLEAFTAAAQEALAYAVPRGQTETENVLRAWLKEHAPQQLAAVAPAAELLKAHDVKHYRV